MKAIVLTIVTIIAFLYFANESANFANALKMVHEQRIELVLQDAR